MYALAKKYGVLILEDNPYGDLRFSGEHVPPIKSLDEDGIVVYCGSFSKVISPGIRVGYAIGPQELLQKMIVCKQGEDVHTNIWSQIVCNELMTHYDFDAHLERLRAIYREKSAFTMKLMNEHLVPNGITYLPIEGGLFLWCTLPGGVDMPAFCKEAVLRKVCVCRATPSSRTRAIPARASASTTPRLRTSSSRRASASWASSHRRSAADRPRLTTAHDRYTIEKTRKTADRV